jgi:hypothetical protein
MAADAAASDVLRARWFAGPVGHLIIIESSYEDVKIEDAH